MDLLGNIIKQMETGAGHSKVATAPSEAPADTRTNGVTDQLHATLVKVAAASTEPSVNSVASPTDALMAQAMKLASAEKHANMEEARLMGTAFADGFLAKMAAAEQGLTPAPQVPAVTAPREQKIASNAIDKVAEDFQAGHDAALQEVANGLGNEFYKGAAETQEMLRRIAAQQ